MTARKLITIRVAQSGVDAIREYAEAEGILRSEAARRALAVGLVELRRQRQKGPR